MGLELVPILKLGREVSRVISDAGTGLNTTSTLYCTCRPYEIVFRSSQAAIPTVGLHIAVNRGRSVARHSVTTDGGHDLRLTPHLWSGYNAPLCNTAQTNSMARENRLHDGAEARLGPSEYPFGTDPRDAPLSARSPSEGFSHSVMNTGETGDDISN